MISCFMVTFDAQKTSSINLQSKHILLKAVSLNPVFFFYLENESKEIVRKIKK